MKGKVTFGKLGGDKSEVFLNFKLDKNTLTKLIEMSDDNGEVDVFNACRMMLIEERKKGQQKSNSITISIEVEDTEPEIPARKFRY